jgi:thiol:disulfide interchange protein DsbD
LISVIIKVKKKNYIFLFLLLTAGFFQAQINGTENVKAELISEVKSIQPGEKFWVALKLEMADQWHTYWRNPGDAGLPTEIEWSLPENFSVSEIYWPYPVLFETSGVVSYGYKDNILLLSQITPPAVINGDKISISADATWLECKELCLPGRAELSLTLLVSSEAELDERWIDSFAGVREMLPVKNKSWEFNSTRTDSSVIIHALLPEKDRSGFKEIRFLPYDEGIYNNSKAQRIENKDEGLFIEVMFADFKLKDPDKVTGIIKTEEPDKNIVNAIEIMVPVSE